MNRRDWLASVAALPVVTLFRRARGGSPQVDPRKLAAAMAMAIRPRPHGWTRDFNYYRSGHWSPVPIMPAGMSQDVQASYAAAFIRRREKNETWVT